MAQAQRASDWPIGFPPSSVHHCNPADASTWKLLPLQPTDTPQGRKLWQCKGCPAKTLR